MTDNPKVVYMHPKQDDVPVTPFKPKKTSVGQKTRNAIPIILREIFSATFALLKPILKMIIGLGALMAYIFFFIGIIIFFTSDDTLKALEMVVGGIVFYLACRLFVTVVEWVERKFNLR